MITEWMRRSSSRLQCGPPLLVGGIIILVIVGASGAPWAQAHAAAFAHAARETAAVLLVLAAYVIVAGTARAVTDRPVPVRRRREGIDLAPLPERPVTRVLPGYDGDPELSPAVYPGTRPPADVEAERAPEVREEVPK